MDASELYIRYGEGSAIYLPPYVRAFRQFESRVVEYLLGTGASEIMLPKLITHADVQALEDADNRFYEEWKDEQFNVYTRKGKFSGYLAHWQCEPVYRALPSLCEVRGEDKLHVLFDNSGYSYRNERSHSPFRFDEFRRIEVFLVGKCDALREYRDQTLAFICTLLPDVPTRCLSRPDESFGGREEVVDVEAECPCESVEICGSHIHFKTFLDKFGDVYEPNIMTGCIGISLSRLTMCDLLRGDQSIAEPNETNSACATDLQH